MICPQRAHSQKAATAIEKKRRYDLTISSRPGIDDMLRTEYSSLMSMKEEGDQTF
jgi:hypothetical protein